MLALVSDRNAMLMLWALPYITGGYINISWVPTKPYKFSIQGVIWCGQQQKIGNSTKLS